MRGSLRPSTPADESFLRRLIAETITLELGASAWPEPMRSHLVGIQASARRATAGDSYIIESEDSPEGWILVACLPHELRLAEVMVATELRGCGIGTAAIRQVQAMADTARKPLRLSVNLTNAGAIRLYARLGFRVVESNEVQQVMEYAPAHFVL